MRCKVTIFSELTGCYMAKFGGEACSAQKSGLGTAKGGAVSCGCATPADRDCWRAFRDYWQNLRDGSDR